MIIEFRLETDKEEPTPMAVAKALIDGKQYGTSCLREIAEYLLVYCNHHELSWDNMVRDCKCENKALING